MYLSQALITGWGFDRDKPSKQSICLPALRGKVRNDHTESKKRARRRNWGN